MASTLFTDTVQGTPVVGIQHHCAGRRPDIFRTQICASRSRWFVGSSRNISTGLISRRSLASSARISQPPLNSLNGPRIISLFKNLIRKGWLRFVVDIIPARKFIYYAVNRQAESGAVMVGSIGVFQPPVHYGHLFGDAVISVGRLLLLQ